MMLSYELWHVLRILFSELNAVVQNITYCDFLIFIMFNLPVKY